MARIELVTARVLPTFRLRAGAAFDLLTPTHGGRRHSRPLSISDLLTQGASYRALQSAGRSAIQLRDQSPEWRPRRRIVPRSKSPCGKASRSSVDTYAGKNPGQHADIPDHDCNGNVSCTTSAETENAEERGGRKRKREIMRDSRSHLPSCCRQIDRQHNNELTIMNRHMRFMTFNIRMHAVRASTTGRDVVRFRRTKSRNIYMVSDARNRGAI